MRVKKSAGKIYGCSLSATEQKALNMEIQRQTAEFDDKNARELDALILWRLHETFGFGEKRLKKFYDGFNDDIHELVKRLQLEEGDDIWLATELLKRRGIDIEAWDKERKNKEANNEH